MGRFSLNAPDEPASSVPTPEGVPRVVVTPTGRGRFGLDAPDPPPDPWANFNKPFGTIGPADVTPTQRTKWSTMDAAIAAGVRPDRARHLAEAGVDIGSILTPAGAVLSGADAIYHGGKVVSGESPWKNAATTALDVLGVLPGVQYLRRGYHAMRGTPHTISGVPEAIPAHVPPPPIGRVRREEPEIRGFVTPTNEEHREAGRAGYRAIEQAPITYPPHAMADMTDMARNALPNPRIGTGVFTPEAAPATHAMLERFGLDFPRGGPRPVNAYDFDILRQGLLNQTGVEKAAGRQAADILDTYMLTPRNVQQGQHLLPALRDAYQAARGNWRVYKTAGAVEDLADAARIGAAGEHSGMNLGNRTRQQFQKYVKTPEGEAKLFGATPAQLDRIEDVVVGDKTTNVARSTSNIFGGGSGIATLGSGGAGTGVGAALGTALGIGPWLGGVAGAGTFMGLGRGARGVANARTAREARDVVTEIQQSSPEYARRAALPENAAIADPRSQMLDRLTMALMPGAREAGTDWINEFYTPYKNR